MRSPCDAVLGRVVAGDPRVPGVVAMITDRDGDAYAGADGERRIDATPMIARFLIGCTGMLCSALEDRFPGQSPFKGPVVHTGRSPKGGITSRAGASARSASAPPASP